MNGGIRHETNQASAAQLAEHLRACDRDFTPPLSHRVELVGYARKIAGHAVRFEAWSGDILAGLVAMYCNDAPGGAAFITSVSVRREWQRRRLATTLLERSVVHARQAGMRRINLDVARANEAAVSFYEQSGFIAVATEGGQLRMSLALEA